MDEGGMLGKLPNEVAASILSRLSMFDIVRVGCTSKRLKVLVSSLQQRFGGSSSSAGPVISLILFHPFCFASAQQDDNDDTRVLSLWVYEYARNALLKLSLSFLQYCLPTLAYPVASDGGLLCIGSGRDFIICNPITKLFVRLPSVPALFRLENEWSSSLIFDDDCMQAFGMVHDYLTGTYDFFLMYFNIAEQDLSMICYRSSVIEWSVLSRLTRHLMTESLWKLCSNAIVSCKSKLYSLWMKGSSIVVMEFCLGGSSWNVIESPDCASALLKAFLLDYEGSLHMVGFVGSVWLEENVWERPTSIRFWKFDVERMDWLEVMRMPASVLDEFRTNIDFDELQCWGKNGILYMKRCWSDVLMFDLSRNEWNWLKDVDVDPDLKGITFEPSLASCVRGSL